MDAVGFHSCSIPGLPTINIPKLGSISLTFKEIADGPSFLVGKLNRYQLAVSCIGDDGNQRSRLPKKYSATDGTAKSSRKNAPQSSDGKSFNSSNQDEIIALFRRIQSSISKGESRSSKISPKSSEEKFSAESVLGVLRQSRKPVKEKYSSKEGDEGLAPRKARLKKQANIYNSSVADFKSTRPPSKFVRRSPIPSKSSSRDSEVKSEASSSTAGKEQALEKIEEMKLPALKELAKSRGIKGYSKLRKSELVELLRSS